MNLFFLVSETGTGLHSHTYKNTCRKNERLQLSGEKAEDVKKSLDVLNCFQTPGKHQEVQLSVCVGVELELIPF